MYSVQYKPKEAGETTEGEAVEEQFFQIYGDKQQLQRLTTRVRFGQVTGVTFDSGAAVKELSKLEGEAPPEEPRLGAAPSRSFNLAHLHDPAQRAASFETTIKPLMVDRRKKNTNLLKLNCNFKKLPFFKSWA